MRSTSVETEFRRACQVSTCHEKGLCAMTIIEFYGLTVAGRSCVMAAPRVLNFNQNPLFRCRRLFLIRLAVSRSIETVSHGPASGGKASGITGRAGGGGGQFADSVWKSPQYVEAFRTLEISSKTRESTPPPPLARRNQTPIDIGSHLIEISAAANREMVAIFRCIIAPVN